METGTSEIPQAAIENIDTRADRGLDRRAVMSTALGDWIDSGRNMLVTGQLAPEVHDVCGDTARHSHLGHRGSGHLALDQHLQLLLFAIAPPLGSGLVTPYHVHPFFCVDTIRP